MLPSGIGYFCGDLTEEEQAVVWATATPPAVELFNEKPKGTAWRTKPSAFIVANNDHAVHPDLERASAERMGATSYAVDSSHVPMLSQPDVVLTGIRNLAATLQRTPAMVEFAPSSTTAQRRPVFSNRVSLSGGAAFCPA